jgi:hypothetical protein
MLVRAAETIDVLAQTLTGLALPLRNARDHAWQNRCKVHFALPTLASCEANHILQCWRWLTPANSSTGLKKGRA